MGFVLMLYSVKPCVSLHGTMRKCFIWEKPPFGPIVPKQSEPLRPAFETKQRWWTNFDCLTREIATWISWLLDYRVTGIHESMKTSRLNHLNISVSFNISIFVMYFNCKHFGWFFGEWRKLLSALSAILKTDRGVSHVKQTFRNGTNGTFER